MPKQEQDFGELKQKLEYLLKNLNISVKRGVAGQGHSFDPEKAMLYVDPRGSQDLIEIAQLVFGENSNTNWKDTSTLTPIPNGPSINEFIMSIPIGDRNFINPIPVLDENKSDRGLSIPIEPNVKADHYPGRAELHPDVLAKLLMIPPEEKHPFENNAPKFDTAELGNPIKVITPLEPGHYPSRVELPPEVLEKLGESSSGLTPDGKPYLRAPGDPMLIDISNFTLEQGEANIGHAVSFNDKTLYVDPSAKPDDFTVTHLLDDKLPKNSKELSDPTSPMGEPGAALPSDEDFFYNPNEGRLIVSTNLKDLSKALPPDNAFEKDIKGSSIAAVPSGEDLQPFKLNFPLTRMEEPDSKPTIYDNPPLKKDDIFDSGQIEKKPPSNIKSVLAWLRGKDQSE